jgi:integrase
MEIHAFRDIICFMVLAKRPIKPLMFLRHSLTNEPDSARVSVSLNRNVLKQGAEIWAGVGPMMNVVGYRGHTYPHRRPLPSSIQSVFEASADFTGVRRFSSHDCRRTFVSNLLEAGVDLATVSKLAGHPHIETTARYDLRGESARRTVMLRLRLPLR